MINDNTFISSFNDRPTLLEWLKKVEEALKGASAVSFNVNKRGDATLTFSILFEDGSEIESGEIILQQGESVRYATIRNGHLILTLTNGDELDAGDLGAVNGFSINASQHLIVTYQNGTTQDLGAIFSGDVAINGGFEVTGTATLPNISTHILNSENDHIEAMKPVIEVMTGYSFGSSSITNLEKTIAFAGTVKNGNKLTLSIFAKLTRKGTIPNGMITLGSFFIPSSIGAKLTPLKETWLEAKSVYFSSDYYNGVNLPSLVSKVANWQLDFNIYDANRLMVENTEYMVRFETTFLLSENLAAL